MGSDGAGPVWRARAYFPPGWREAGLPVQGLGTGLGTGPACRGLGIVPGVVGVTSALVSGISARWGSCMTLSRPPSQGTPHDQPQTSTTPGTFSFDSSLPSKVKQTAHFLPGVWKATHTRRKGRWGSLQVPVVFHDPRKLRDLARSHGDGRTGTLAAPPVRPCPRRTAATGVERGLAAWGRGYMPRTCPPDSKPAAPQLVTTITKSFSCLSSAA